MGADEQLGGYSKHKAAFLNGGRESLLIELQRQIDAISERNLGRDNRIGNVIVVWGAAKGAWWASGGNPPPLPQIGRV